MRNLTDKTFSKTLKPDSNPRGGDEVEVLWQSARMVACSQLLGESSTLIRIALKDSDLKVIKIIVNF